MFSYGIAESFEHHNVKGLFKWSFEVLITMFLMMFNRIHLIGQASSVVERKKEDEMQIKMSKKRVIIFWEDDDEEEEKSHA